MRNVFIFSICILFSGALIGQTERIALSGKIRSDSIVLENVHVINKTSNRGTISNSEGVFKINVKENDTLLFSEISHKIKQLIVKKEMLDKGEIKVILEVNTNKLDEVVIFKNKAFTNPLGIPNMGKKKLNKDERELNFYSQESLPIIILQTIFGKVGGMNDIWYVVSGNRKKFRAFMELKRQDEINAYNATVCQDIRKHFGDAFFTKTLKLKPEEIDIFLRFCIPKNIVLLFDENRELELIDVLITQTDDFKSK